MLLYQLPKIMIISLSCTIIIELLFAYLFLRIKNKSDLLVVLLVNTMTNPLVVSISYIVNYFLGLHARNIILVILEILAFLIESLFYKKNLEYKKINPFMVSLILNFASYFIGCIINGIIY